MGSLNEGRFDGGLENGVGLRSVELESESGLGSGSEAESTRVIEDAVKVLLQGLGEDYNREGLKKTPLRVAKALREGTRGYRQKEKDIVQGALFPESGLDNGTGHAGGAGGLVVVRDIDLFSYCESCLLPFKVQFHVGYVPSGKRVVGLSKLSRVADVFAKRLQDPQRLADEVCLALHNSIKPAGVAVVLQCWHIQFPEALRCNHIPKHPTNLHLQGWVQSSVSSSAGVFEDEHNTFWDEFLALLEFRGISMTRNLTQSSPIQSWCPSRSHEVAPSNGHSTRNLLNSSIPSRPGATQNAMVAAVASILHSLGEDPLRKELVGTPFRFVQWLMKFEKSKMEMKLNGFNFSRNGLHKKTDHVGHDRYEIHTELNLPFCSQCEHHLLPFHGVVHIGYFDVDEGKAIERSILQSIVHFYGFKLQVQERLTRQIAETISSIFKEGVMVVVEANHICMISRGIEKVGSSTATIAVTGRFSTNPAAKAKFLQVISKSTASQE